MGDPAWPKSETIEEHLFIDGIDPPANFVAKANISGSLGKKEVPINRGAVNKIVNCQSHRQRPRTLDHKLSFACTNYYGAIIAVRAVNKSIDQNLPNGRYGKCRTYAWNKR
jgi:hypothetical protein